MITNKMRLEIDAKSENESFARTVVAAFVARLDPTLEELNDVKTAVSEAVTNAIIHGYNEMKGTVYISCLIDKNTVLIQIEDHGIGIEDIGKAMEPLYTSKPDLERSGMGFTVMEAFMDSINVTSNIGKGTLITMKKTFDSIHNRVD
ncbi:MAG: hypothetical protein K0R15_2071 [Clostridiales bacterium]|jgi:stage II sporulation protein AB (anti-sigma F factor)|nr:hypothetical protein [Clostridiales bacterium]